MPSISRLQEWMGAVALLECLSVDMDVIVLVPIRKARGAEPPRRDASLTCTGCIVHRPHGEERQRQRSGRLLPSIIDAVSKDGGRVDITRRGVPVASIVRTSELADEGSHFRKSANLALDFGFDPAELVDVVRELRSRVGRPRPGAMATRRRKRSRK
jgi:antitoxin (DNA-binding transcriptional repressor) of toxin-antitoxin stability system